MKRWGLVGGMEKIKMEVKRMEEEEGRWRWREKSASRNTGSKRERGMEQEWRRDGAYRLEITAGGGKKKERKERGREPKSDSLTATPNGFSGEREGEECRGGEGIMRGL